MDPPKLFPILRLPFVPLQEIFKAMDPFEIINFSMISKRTKAVTKQMTFYSKYSIQIEVDEELELRILGPKYMTQCLYIFTIDEEMNGQVSENKRIDGKIEKRVSHYFEDPVNEWKQLCKHVLEIFKKETIDVLSMTMDAFADQNISIIDFLKTIVKSVNDCDLFHSEEENDVDEHATYLLDNLKVNDELNSYVDIKSDNFDGKIPKNLKELLIKNSQWIEYERLLEIDCKSVILEYNLISDKEWNLFFKKWIAMETNQNLEHLELDYIEIGEFRDHVLHDIPHEMVDEGVKRVMKTRRNRTQEITESRGNATQEISGGIDIKRIDGKTATFFVYREYSTNRFAMSIH
ncbi:hypothetical protein GCK72_015436 [Caenorhabditis remanei]|uniref:F-box domain-containing protein n=1 Tax=Caenorhabditis remanei TaxID=31234 RepID=A0A6A5GWI1_CAERE|nr:hypothetical protein GCK72_015436 [Caenorhabditis remanei]KAF1758976.1 hypothetical protein GCK72_015436 [Caenorhabditis remanei]